MKTQLIVALDLDTGDAALDLVDRIGSDVLWYKVGKQLFTREGPTIVRRLKSCGRKVFLDLKFHDIPNTVSQAVESAAAAGADMVNVHALGGPAMLQAAAQAGAATGVMVIAVTVLTSMDAEQLVAVGLPAAADVTVRRLALLSRESGLAGVVCSAHEAAIVREVCGADFKTVVPGIRPIGTSHGDQKRVGTPAAAARDGAHYIVVGRPVTQAVEPAVAARGILKELNL